MGTLIITPVVVPPPSGTTLTWSGVSDPALAGYRVYYGTVTKTYQQPGKGVDVGKATSFALTGFAPGTYFMCVCWYDEFGSESNYSAEVTKVVT